LCGYTGHREIAEKHTKAGATGSGNQVFSPFSYHAIAIAKSTPLRGFSQQIKQTLPFSAFW